MAVELTDEVLKQKERPGEAVSITKCISAVENAKGQRFFRCTLDTNSWVAINPDVTLWISQVSQPSVILVYSRHRFPPDVQKQPFVAVNADGKLVMISSLPNWEPVDIKAIARDSHGTQ